MKQIINYLCAIFFLINVSALSQSRSFQFLENNNNVRKLQRSGGKTSTIADVKIEFYGHMAFKITSPNGLTIMIDPWRNDPTGTFGIWYPHDFPEIAVDIAMSTHAHFDHDAIYRTHATMNLERMVGEFKLSDVKITGIADKHQCVAPGEINWSDYLAKEFKLDNICDEDRPMSWDNVFYKIETGGLKIGFWGDNSPTPNALVQKELQNLDVLIMNIDGSGHILSYKQVDFILNKYKPKVVIPGHYLTKGANLESSTLKSADEWVNKQKNKVYLKTSELTLNYKKIKREVNKVYYFGANYSKK